MEIRQKTELKKLLVPELNQSLKILALPLDGLEKLISEELQANPFLEEIPRKEPLPRFKKARTGGPSQAEIDFRLSNITKKTSLQEVLLRQLGIFTDNDLDYKIGYEIIGNIDDNGYLKPPLEFICAPLGISPARAEKILKVIQQFDPPGVGARSVAECLLIQLELAGESGPLLRQIILERLDDVAKKNYSRIAKALKKSPEEIEPLIKKISRLNPKPGRNYSPEEVQRVIPDVNIDEDLEISINDEDIPLLNINKAYKEMLKNNAFEARSREFMVEKLQSALALVRAVSRRKFTLRRIVEAIVDIQQEAVINDMSCLKPLTFQDIAKKLDINESTVCRAVMNKYAALPYGVVALKSFFTSSIQDNSGQALSSSHVKKLIKDMVEAEDKKHPLSDQDICARLSGEHSLKVSRRTVAKYRDEMKILSTAFRRER